MDYPDPKTRSDSVFWVGEPVSPDALQRHCEHLALKGLTSPKATDFRLIRLQSEFTSHPLYPTQVGLLALDESSTDWSGWGPVLLERFPESYLIRLDGRAMGEIKNHLLGLRLVQIENGRLVQWPWFNPAYFMALCQQTEGLRRERLLGPIHSVASLRDGAWDCIRGGARQKASLPKESRPLVVNELTPLMQLALKDYANALAMFIEQHASELSITSGVELNIVCSQAIPLALAQGFYSAELVGIWVLIGLIQAGRQQGLPRVDGHCSALMDAALQSGLSIGLLASLSHQFKAWPDVRYPWLGGSSPHSIWEMQALSQLQMINPEIPFNSTGVLSQLKWNHQMDGLEFEWIDESGGSGQLFSAEEVHSRLLHFIDTKRSSHPLLPAVHRVQLMPTRLASMPLGHVNLKTWSLEKHLSLVNRTCYGINLSVQAGGYQRLVFTQHQAGNPDQSSGHRGSANPPRIEAQALLDQVSQPLNPIFMTWRIIQNKPDGIYKTAILECRELYPALNVKARWVLSECATKLKVQLHLHCLWSEDFLQLSAWADVCEVESCLRIRPTKAIEWHVSRSLEIPLDAVKPDSILCDERFQVPVEASMEAGHLAQQQPSRLKQVYLASRLCGEVQLQCLLVYCEQSSNLKLHVIGKLSPLALKVTQSELTWGQQRKVQTVVKEILLFAGEFTPHG